MEIGNGKRVELTNVTFFNKDVVKTQMKSSVGYIPSAVIDLCQKS
jgi:hypothetical protein